MIRQDYVALTYYAGASVCRGGGLTPSVDKSEQGGQNVQKLHILWTSFMDSPYGLLSPNIK